MRRAFLTRVLPALLLVLAGGGAAVVAQRLAEVDAVCPLYGHRFKAQALASHTEMSAFDSDLCKRSLGQSPYLLDVWTCPYCFFSAYQADFHGTLGPEFRDMELRRYPIDPTRVTQLDIFVGTKYLNAEVFYRKLGKDARFLADLTLRGSYACRVQRLRETPEFDSLRAKRMDEVLGGKKRLSVEEVNLELARRVRQELDSGKLAPEQQRIDRYLLADALRQAGERLSAQEILEALMDEGRLPDRYLENARQKAFLCRKEGEFQEKALNYLRQAESEGLIPQEERARVTYLMGELSRRLGRYDDARRLYQQAAGMATKEKWLPAMIANQMERLPKSSPAGEEAGGG